MASERALRRAALAGLTAALAVLAAPLAATAQAPVPTRTPAAPATQPPTAAEPWWIPVAFQGQAVSDVRAEAGLLTVGLGSAGQQQSSDGGRTWQPHVERHGVVPPQAGEWRICDGRVGRADAGGACHVDPGSPRVRAPGTAGHDVVAALPGSDGLVVAVDVEGVVWRRGGDGHWARALLLLDQDLLHGPPRITGVASFAEPLSDAVYLATNGYSVIESTDGGDDWVRANPGLPDGVLAITTDSSRRAVYAATRDGLWLHHLQPTPAPPVYAGEDLTLRVLGTAAVCLAAVAAALGGMMRLLR